MDVVAPWGCGCPQRAGCVDLLQQWPFTSKPQTRSLRASPLPRLGPAGGRTDALTPGDTASLAAGRVQDRWPHPTGWGRAGILPRSPGPREGQGSAPRALRGRTRNQPPRRHPSGRWHGPSPANGDRPQFSPSASPASRRLRPLLGFLQKQTSESAPSERAPEGGVRRGSRGGARRDVGSARQLTAEGARAALTL